MQDTRRSYDHVAGLYVPVALAVALVVFALVILFAWRYRAGRDRGPGVSGPDSAPRLELAYAIALAGIAAVLLAATYHTENREDRLAAHPALTVDVTAAKWRWRFDYPGTGVSQLGGERGVPTLVVPTDRTVRFRMTSLDVVHAFWIPDRRFKRDAIPGRTTSFDLRFPAGGDYAGMGECSEFCGLGHADMRFYVRALAPAEFRAWLARRSAGA